MVSVDIYVVAHECYIDINDTGRGILENNFDRVFDRFVQANEGYVKSGKGSGLGLSIAKNLVKLMNGELYIKESIEGIGTTFTIKFPIDINGSKKPV